MIMSVAMLEKLGSDASLHANCDKQSNSYETPIKQWCILMLDDSETPEMNEEVQGDVETQLH